MSQSASTSNHLCACGCGEPVKPEQRWREPACKARAYRARQREADYAYLDEVEADRRYFFQRTLELGRKLEALEQVYSELWEAHQDCPPAPPADTAPRPWFEDAYAVLGVRADAEWEAIEGAYKGLVKKYHSDGRPADPVRETQLKAINAAYDALKRRRGRR